MKLRSYRLERSPKLMIIPMIDIIFFLLVFFMMSTLNMVYQKTLPVNLPHAAAMRQDLDEPIGVAVTAAGSIHWEDEEIALEALSARMRAELARRPQIAVILRADQHVEHGKVVAVMDELKTAGVQKLAVATQAKPR